MNRVTWIKMNRRSTMAQRVASQPHSFMYFTCTAAMRFSSGKQQAHASSEPKLFFTESHNRSRNTQRKLTVTRPAFLQVAFVFKTLQMGRAHTRQTDSAFHRSLWGFFKNENHRSDLMRILFMYALCSGRKVLKAIKHRLMKINMSPKLILAQFIKYSTPISHNF